MACKELVLHEECDDGPACFAFDMDGIVYQGQHEPKHATRLEERLSGVERTPHRHKRTTNARLSWSLVLPSSRPISSTISFGKLLNVDFIYAAYFAGSRKKIR
jgi:ribonucleotide monophosphatase NagD (HAD superfamily)